MNIAIWKCSRGAGLGGFRLLRLAGLCAFLMLVPASGILAQSGPPPAPSVTVATPHAQRITNWDEFTGRFEAVEQVEVRPRV